MPTDAVDAQTNALWPMVVAGLLAGLAYCDLAQRSGLPGGASFWDLLRTSGLVLLAIAGACFWISRQPQQNPTTTRRLILGFSLLFHLIGVSGSPILEDDWNRYLFDGWVFDTLGSPYGIPPSSFFTDDAVPPAYDALLSDINNPDLPTIYGPTLEWIFRALHRVAPASLLALQLVVASFSFGLVCLIARTAHPAALLFFAWHPLLVKEFAFSAHSESVAVALMVIAMSIPERAQKTLGALLAVAVGAKLFVLLIVPGLLRRSAAGWVTFGLALAALYGPFYASSMTIMPEWGDLLAQLRSGPLAAMGFGWIFNAPLYVLLQDRVEPLGLRLFLGTLFVGYWFMWTRTAWSRSDGTTIHGDHLFGAMLLCMPVLNPWYVLWPLVFWTQRPSLWLGVASVSVLLAYATGLNLGRSDLAPYEISDAVLVLEFGLIAAAFAARPFLHRSSFNAYR